MATEGYVLDARGSSLVDAVWEAPADEARRLILADFLDDLGHHLAAAFLRGPGCWYAAHDGTRMEWQALTARGAAATVPIPFRFGEARPAACPCGRGTFYRVGPRSGGWACLDCWGDECLKEKEAELKRASKKRGRRARRGD